MFHSNIPLTDSSVPDRVSGVSLTKTVASGAPALRVTWSTPYSDVTISQYQVEYRKRRTTSWSSATSLSVSPPATSIILTELNADTEYSIRVRAVSECGSGEWSVAKSTFNSECFQCVIPAAIRCTCICATFSYNYYGNDGLFQCRLKVKIIII